MNILMLLCLETKAACRPCKTARRLIGGDESKFSPNIYSDRILKLLKQGNGVKIGLKMSDSDDDNDNAKLGTNEVVKLLGASQVGTPLPSVELVKELLQSGTALNPDTSNKAPLIANDQSLLFQQSPASVPSAAMIPQSFQPQQFVQQDLPQQQSFQTQQDNVDTLSPQLMAPGMALKDNQKTMSPLLKTSPTNPSLMAQDDAFDSPLTVQPVALNPKLLSQAILETGKLQQEKSAGVPVGALSTLPVQNSDYFTNKIASFQGNTATSLPITADVDVSKATQFHSARAMPDLQLPMQLGAPARKTNWFGFSLSSAANKKSPFEDEYKYDINDKEGDI